MNRIFVSDVKSRSYLQNEIARWGRRQNFIKRQYPTGITGLDSPLAENTILYDKERQLLLHQTNSSDLRHTARLKCIMLSLINNIIFNLI